MNAGCGTFSSITPRRYLQPRSILRLLTLAAPRHKRDGELNPAEGSALLT